MPRPGKSEEQLKKEILEFLKENHMATPYQLSKKCHVSYYKVLYVLAKLESEGKVVIINLPNGKLVTLPERIKDTPLEELCKE